MSAKYTLDSAIIRDVNENHFACVLLSIIVNTDLTGKL